MNDIILESISDGVFTVDNEWRITSFNRAAERITGIPRGEALGRLCHEVFKSNMCEGECPLRKTLRSGKAIIDRRGGFCVNLQGERIPISVSTAILYDVDGRQVGGAETFRDLRELEELRQRLKQEPEPLDSANPAMHKLLALLPTVADSDSSVLIEGETGTGKEVLARALHRRSNRAGGAFVAVNCSALPDALLESELFGYKRGAFTGADKDKPGRFAAAQGGTLFLDELGEISLAMQAKLLRVLQERHYEPLGSNETVAADFRLLTASNRSLADLVESGRFRRDLYYRVNVIRMVLPPLRERREDTLLLAERFLQRHRERRPSLQLLPETARQLLDYPWPGNIRELEHVIERAAVLCVDGQIGPDCLPDEMLLASREPLKARQPQGALSNTGRSAVQAREEAERLAIVEALDRSAWQCTRAAAELGMDKSTLYRKMARFTIRRPQA